jgi:hypothetical protein
VTAARPHDAAEVDRPAAARREGGAQSDQDDAEERDPGADQQPARDALPQEHPAAERDQDRPDPDEHGRGAGVEAALREVERDVVRAEPGDAVYDDLEPLAAGGPHPAALHERHDPERDRADREPAERQRPAADVRGDAADHHEGAGPGEQRDHDRDQDEGAFAVHVPDPGADR